MVLLYTELGSEVEFIAVKSKANGHWGFPKGQMEKGESEEETANGNRYLALASGGGG